MAAVLFSFAYPITFVISTVLLSLLLGKGTVLERMPIAFFLNIGAMCLVAGLLTIAGIAYSLAGAFAANVIVAGGAVVARRRWSKNAPNIRVADALDVFALVAIVVVACVCAYRQFGAGLVPTFATVDPAVHARESWQIVETGSVSTMYFTHLFTATWMAVVSPYFDGFVVYKVFIVCETVYWAAGALAFYSLVKNGSNRVKSTISVIISLVYMLGYPLLNNVFGFSYLGVGVSLIAVSMWVADRREAFPNRALYYAMLSLSLFGLIVSYPLFVPVIYLAAFLFVVIDERGRSSSVKRIAITELAVFAVPVCLGFVLVYLPLFSDSLSVSGALALDGGTYKNLYGNFVFVAPAFVYGFIVHVRNNKASFAAIATTFMLLFAFALLLIGVLGYVSPYYFYKCHFVLWLLVFYFAAYGLNTLADSDKLILGAYGITWLMMMCLAASGIDNRLAESRPQFNESAESWNNFDVMRFNKNFLSADTIADDEIALYRDYDKLTEGDSDEEIMIIGHIDSMAWFEAMTHRSLLSDGFWNMTDDQFASRVEKCNYILVLTTDWSRQCPLSSKDGTPTADIIDEYLSSGEVIECNDAGCIIKVD